MHVGLISDGCGEAQRVLILHEQQACLKACVVSVVSDRVDPCQSTQRHYATAATRPHQRIAQGAAALRHADARYRSAAAGRISATLTTHKPRIGGACSQHAVRRITSAGQDPPYGLGERRTVTRRGDTQEARATEENPAAARTDRNPAHHQATRHRADARRDAAAARQLRQRSSHDAQAPHRRGLAANSGCPDLYANETPFTQNSVHPRLTG